MLPRPSPASNPYEKESWEYLVKRTPLITLKKLNADIDLYLNTLPSNLKTTANIIKWVAGLQLLGMVSAFIFGGWIVGVIALVPILIGMAYDYLNEKSPLEEMLSPSDPFVILGIGALRGFFFIPTKMAALLTKNKIYMTPRGVFVYELLPEKHSAARFILSYLHQSNFRNSFLTGLQFLNFIKFNLKPLVTEEIIKKEKSRQVAFLMGVFGNEKEPKKEVPQDKVNLSELPKNPLFEKKVIPLIFDFFKPSEEPLSEDPSLNHTQQGIVNNSR